MTGGNITLQSYGIRVVVAPEMGAQITSLMDSDGHEYLASGLYPRPGNLGLYIPYNDGGLGGIDDAGAAIAVNDSGLVNHAADIRCVDLWGLANVEVAAARRAKRYSDPATMRAVAAKAGADVAIVFDRWFERFGGLPDDWIRVGAWTIPDNVACGSPTVSFYATNAGARDRLAESLRAFSARLPARVRTSGAYLEAP